MSKASSRRRSAQLAALTCSVPSHRIRQPQPPQAGPAKKPSPGTAIQPPPGYTAQKDGRVVVVRRADMGKDAAPVSSRASCPEHRLHLQDDVGTDDAPRRVGVPGRQPIKPAAVLPMRVAPLPWRAK